MRTLPALPALPAEQVPESTRAVETTMFRALAVLRVVLLLNVVAVNLSRPEQAAHPVGVLALEGVLALWTVLTIVWYAGPRRRAPGFLVADLGVSVGALVASPLLVGPAMQATVPGFWIAGGMVAWAVVWHWRGGLVAALVVVLADLSVRDGLTACNYGNLFLLAVGGPILGLCVGLLAESAEARDRAERLAAAEHERQRLARVVHDGVLQVLTLVQRRGLEIGGETADLARLAGEQEQALRQLVQRHATPPSPGTAGSATWWLLSSRCGPRPAHGCG